jgi:hypothetical protein
LITLAVSYICIYKGFQTIPNSITPKPDRPQHDRYTTCVIAQQYSFSIFDLIKLSVATGKTGGRVQKILVQFSYFVKSLESQIT